MRVPLFLSAAILFVSGCATLFSGTDEPVTFLSEPSGARVTIDGIDVGTTPTTVEVDRPGLNDMDVTVQLEGYEPRTFELDKKFNNTSIWNILFWPGFVVDALSGALYEYDKTTYTVDLQDGTISMNIEDLPRGSSGQYLLPDVEERVIVTDKARGLRLEFK